MDDCRWHVGGCSGRAGVRRVWGFDAFGVGGGLLLLLRTAEKRAVGLYVFHCTKSEETEKAVPAFPLPPITSS